MNQNGACPSCGSTDVITDARIVDRTLEEELRVTVERRPHAKVFKGTVGVTLKARVCGACGRTELYVSDPARLLAAHKESG